MDRALAGLRKDFNVDVDGTEKSLEDERMENGYHETTQNGK